jgi:hypothetical protein
MARFISAKVLSLRPDRVRSAERCFESARGALRDGGRGGGFYDARRVLYYRSRVTDRQIPRLLIKSQQMTRRARRNLGRESRRRDADFRQIQLAASLGDARETLFGTN